LTQRPNIKRFLNFSWKGRRNTANALTFVWDDKAKKGYTFFYEGVAKDCKECSYFNVCQGNLEAKNLYRVTEVRDKLFDCLVFGKKARLVEVQLAEVDAAVDPKYAIEGALVNFKPRSCGDLLCEMFDVCVPDGLEPGRRYKLTKIHGSFTCQKDGKKLIRVSLLPHVSQRS